MTQVWYNKENGHQFEFSSDGVPMLNGKICEAVPEWVQGDADFVFGPMNEWRGGECPVDHNVEIRAIFRGRRPYIGPAVYPHMPKCGQDVMWQHAPYPGRSNPGADIVAYQVRVA